MYKFNGCLEVRDNGRGMPVDLHAGQGIPGIELIFTRLHAGGKFDNKSYSYSGGLHGVGAAVVNALSRWLTAEVVRDGKRYEGWPAIIRAVNTTDAMSATMFTQSMYVVDKMLATRNGLPGNVLLRPEQLERAHKMGENIIKAINTPVEERGWLGDEGHGMCPNCHSNLIYKGETHWDGIKFPFECAVCGAGGQSFKIHFIISHAYKVRFVLF